MDVNQVQLRLNEIFNEDCIKFMEGLDKGIVDVIVTSPPYNLNKKYSYYRDNKERDEYLQWLGKIAKISRRVLKKEGSLKFYQARQDKSFFLKKDVKVGYVGPYGESIAKIVKANYNVEIIDINKEIFTDNNG